MIWYDRNGDSRFTLTCADKDCSDCEGRDCNKDFIMTVSTEEYVSDLSPVSDCKYGDTVKIERVSGGDRFSVFEIAIVGKPGNLHIQIY